MNNSSDNPASPRELQLIGRDNLRGVACMNDEQWSKAIKEAGKKIREENSDAVFGKIQGTKAHMPTSDQAETEPVVTMVVYDEDQKRLFTVHIHGDASYKIGGKEGLKLVA